MRRNFAEVDVFTPVPYRGNPVAVVLDGSGLSAVEMQRFANWTNFSETTFVTEPSDPAADYAVRIFTPSEELPFAGHPTIGTCHAWLGNGGTPQGDDVVVQQCAVGLVPLRRGGGRLAFAAPPLIRGGPLDDVLVAEVASILGVDPADIVDSAWIDNGPGWIGVLLSSAEEVLAIRPSDTDRKIGVIGPHPDGSPYAYEVRGFFPVNGRTAEDPVTGSLNASAAQWLIGAGRFDAPFVATQGAAVGRAGAVHIEVDDAGQVWVGGDAVTCVAGTVEL